MKKSRIIKPLLEELSNFPNMSVACKKLGISRNSVNRWTNEDTELKEKINQSLADGESHLNDIAENQHLKKLQEGDTKAIYFHLDRCHPRYAKPKFDPSVLEILEQQQKVKKDIEVKAISDELRMHGFETMMKDLENTEVEVTERTAKKLEDGVNYSEE